MVRHPKWVFFGFHNENELCAHQSTETNKESNILKIKLWKQVWYDSGKTEQLNRKRTKKKLVWKCVIAF